MIHANTVQALLTREATETEDRLMKRFSETLSPRVHTLNADD